MGVNNFKNTNNISIKGGKKSVKTEIKVTENIPVDNSYKAINAYELNVDAVTQKELKNKEDLNVLKNLESLDLEHLKVNHDNKFPLWMFGRDDENIERLYSAGYIKKAAKQEDIKLTAKGKKIAEMLKEEHVFPLDVFKFQSSPRSEKDVYQDSLVIYNYKGTEISSNSAIMNKWQFNMTEYDKIENPEDKDIHRILNLSNIFDKQATQFKNHIETSLETAKKSNQEIVPVGYREESHKIVFEGDYDNKKVFFEIPNNYYSYLKNKYGLDIKTVINKEDLENKNSGTLGKDIQMTIVKDGKIIATIANGFYISSENENKKIENQLKYIYQ